MNENQTKNLAVNITIKPVHRIMVGNIILLENKKRLVIDKAYSDNKKGDDYIVILNTVDVDGGIKAFTYANSGMPVPYHGFSNVFEDLENEDDEDE